MACRASLDLARQAMWAACCKEGRPETRACELRSQRCAGGAAGHAEAPHTNPGQTPRTGWASKQLQTCRGGWRVPVRKSKEPEQQKMAVRGLPTLSTFPLFFVLEILSDRGVLPFFLAAFNLLPLFLPGVFTSSSFVVSAWPW